MQLIETNPDLENLCARLQDEPFVCVDLEFLRERTYFAQLCLIQIASPEVAAVIDPLAEGLNLVPFFALMHNPDITKVFHSGRQDIELIFQLSGEVPTPLFDSQIAASALGFGEAISYENLVKSMLDINLDKTSRLSDWSRRPLSADQLDYALGDVTYLCRIYPKLLAKLQQLGRTNWIEEELAALGAPALYQIAPDNVWQKMRHRSHNAKFLTLLRELAAWREKRAIAKNVPRQSFIKDDLLLNICTACPCTKDALTAVRGMRADLAKGKLGDEIIEVVQNFKALPKSAYVTIDDEDKNLNYDAALLEVLKMVLRICASKHNITPKLLASEDELKHFCAQGLTDEVRFMSGWRYEIFGALVQKICSRHTAIAYNPNNHSIELIDC